MSQETTKNKTVKTRIFQKHDFECNWLKAVNFKPHVAELIVYDAEVDSEGNVLDGLSVNERGREPYSFSRLKIGDGLRLVTDLPFCEADVTKEYVDNAVEELSSSIDLVEERAEQAESIAKGKNQAKVFDTEQKMLDTVKGWYCIYPGRTLPAGSTIIMSTGGALKDATEGKATYSHYAWLSINDEEIYHRESYSPVSIEDRLVCTYVLDRDITIEKIEYEIYAYGYIDEVDEEGNWIDATYHYASFSGPSRLSYSVDSYQYGDTTVPTFLIKPLDISVGDNLYIRELDKPDYWWDGSQPQPLETQKVDLTSIPGQKVEGGGEIFNDYNSNQALSEFSHAEGNKTVAGSKAFKIKDMHQFGDTDEGRFLLESVESLSSGMKYTAVLTNNFDFIGIIESVVESDAEYGPNIVVKGLPSGSGLTIKDTSYLLIPDRPDLGDIVIGEYAHAEGTETTAQAKAAHAEGNKTNAAGKYAHAEGHSTVAAYAAHAEGHTTEAIGEASHSEGKKSKATKLAAHAEGSGTNATAEAAHSEGRNTHAENTSAHAEGEGTTASGFAAHSEGQSTIASGDQAHAEGYDTDATGTTAHAEGSENLAEGYASHAEGHRTRAYGDMSHAGGYESVANERGTFVHGSNLIAEHNDQTVFGQFNDPGAYEDLFIVGNGDDNEHRANAFVVHRDGTATIQHGPINSNDVADKEYVDDSIAYAIDNESVGKAIENGGEIFNDYVNNKADGLHSHVSGTQSRALGEASFVHGTNSVAYADSGIALGYNNSAGALSFPIVTPEGGYTEDDYSNNRYYIALPEETSSIHELGLNIPTPDEQTSLKYTVVLTSNFNLRTGVKTIGDNFIEVLDYIKPNSEVSGSNVQSGGSSYIMFPYRPDFGWSPVGTGTIADGYDSKAVAFAAHAEGYDTLAEGKYSHAEGYSTIACYAAHSEGRQSKATGERSHAEGYGSESRGFNSHAEGYHGTTIGRDAHAEGHNTLAFGDYSHNEGFSDTVGSTTITADELKTKWASAKNFSAAVGDGSHVEGYNSFVSGKYGHAEGSKTNAEGDNSHAEGNSTKASGLNSHAEGTNTNALGIAAHSEGNNTKASANASHAEGSQTEATVSASHAEGYLSKAQGDSSHAEGSDTLAKGHYSHAEGRQTQALGNASHAGGYQSIANKERSFVHGTGLTATMADQAVFGRYNATDDAALLIVGSGTSTDKKNAFVVNKNGSAYSSKSTTQTDADLTLTTKDYVDAIKETAEEAHSIAKGANIAEVFENEYEMNNWITSKELESLDNVTGKQVPSSGKYYIVPAVDYQQVRVVYFDGTEAMRFVNACSISIKYTDGTEYKSSFAFWHDSVHNQYSRAYELFPLENGKTVEDVAVEFFYTAQYDEMMEGLIVSSDTTCENLSLRMIPESSEDLKVVDYVYEHPYGGTYTRKGLSSSNAQSKYEVTTKYDIKLGTNFYIRAVNVPDYWWDGAKACELETKVDLTEYATKEWVEDKGYLTQHQSISHKLDRSEFEAVIGTNSIKIGGTTFTEDDLKKILRFIKTFDFGGNE